MAEATRADWARLAGTAGGVVVDPLLYLHDPVYHAVCKRMRVAPGMCRCRDGSPAMCAIDCPCEFHACSEGWTRWYGR